MARGATVALLLLMLSPASSASASKPLFLDAPQLRIELGTHTGFIKKLAVSADGGTVLTVSDDKTARVWDSATGRLRHVLRVPIDPGHEGLLYAGTLTPDGRYAVVGGFTGLTVGTGGTLYVFDASTGQLLGGLGHLPEFAIENLEFSSDGRTLAICQADGAGVIFFDWLGKRMIRRDTSPTDKILGADFAPNGDFVLTTLDGRLWLYDAASGYASSRSSVLDVGHKPMHVQFSPDGLRLAVGFDAEPIVAILQTKTLLVERVLRLPESDGQSGLHVVDWSSDGRAIYTGGQPTDPRNARIYRWAADGSALPTLIVTTTRRVSDLRRLATGGFAFSSGQPEVGVVGADGALRWRQSSQTLDSGQTNDLFAIDWTGARVGFADQSSTDSLTFDVNAPLESALTRGRSATETIPRRSAKDWNLAIRDEGASLSVNGNDVATDHAERIRTWAYGPGDRNLLLGTAWSLRLVDRNGRLIWRADAPEDTRAVAVTNDARLAVASFADGTIRWYRMKDGAEVLAFLPHRNGVDWVAWIPSGYYMSSVNGDNLIGWHLNNGLDQTPEFYRAIQFERILYRPDVVREYFRSMGETDVRTILADASAFRIDDLRRLAPPQLDIRNLTVQSAATVPTARFTLTGSSKSLPLQDYTVFVNDIPVTPWSDRALSQSDALAFQRNLDVPLTSKDNQIRVEVFNGQSMGVVEAAAELPQAPRLPPRGDLYLVAIGVNRFANFGSDDTRIPDLRFAAQDADEVARYFETAATDGEFRRVHTFLASDNATDPPTRDVVKRLVAAVRDAGPLDTVIVFLASHGWSDPQGNYYFFPADTQPEDIDRLAAGRSDVKTLIDWQFFFDEMRRAAGRRVLIVDTCNSADMRGTLDVHTLAKRSAASRFALMAASKGDELSQEYASGGHGIFTFGLLQALRNGADTDGDGETTLREAFTHAYEVVQTTRPNKTRPQTPQLEAPTVLQTVVVASDSRSTGTTPGPSGVHVQ